MERERDDRRFQHFDGHTLVVLTLESVKVDQDGAGRKTAHVAATARLDRKDFGVGAGYGFFTVGKTVEIFLEVQGIPKSAP